MVHAVYACCGLSEMATVPTVFASRHGDCAGAVDLMVTLAHRGPLTASGFSHSVHNASAGLYSIASGNFHASTSTAGGSSSFGSGVIEALAMLARCSTGRVLFVIADEAVPPVFATLSPEPSVPYVVALLLASEAQGRRVRLTSADRMSPPGSPPWPDAVEFLRWMLSSEDAVTIGTGRNRTRWTRVSD